MRNYDNCWLRFVSDFPTTINDTECRFIPVYFASGSRIKVEGIWEQKCGGFYVSLGSGMGFSEKIEEHQFQVEME
jgi:hypothetical protein